MIPFRSEQNRCQIYTGPLAPEVNKNVWTLIHDTPVPQSLVLLNCTYIYIHSTCDICCPFRSEQNRRQIYTGPLAPKVNRNLWVLIHDTPVPNLITIRPLTEPHPHPPTHCLHIYIPLCAKSLLGTLYSRGPLPLVESSLASLPRAELGTE